MVARSLEGRSKKLDDALRLYREGLELSRARFSPPGSATAKDYLRGNAYACWKESICEWSGDRYEAQFAIRPVECSSKGSSLRRLQDDTDIRRILDGQDKVVFVGYIQGVERKERRVSALVGLSLPTEISGNGPCAWANNLSVDFGLEPFSITYDWEIALRRTLPVGACARVDEVVQSRAKVVDRIAHNSCQVRRDGSPGNHETRSLRHWVTVDDGSVGVGVKVVGGASVEIGDVVFRPIEL